MGVPGLEAQRVTIHKGTEAVLDAPPQQMECPQGLSAAQAPAGKRADGQTDGHRCRVTVPGTEKEESRGKGIPARLRDTRACGPHSPLLELRVTRDRTMKG